MRHPRAVRPRRRHHAHPSACRLRTAPAAVRPFRSAPAFAHHFCTPFGASKPSVDPAKGVIYGVSVITANLEAKGHGLYVDAATLQTLFDCAVARGGKIAVKADHGSGIANITGYLDNFRIEFPRLRADWHLLDACPHRAQFLEMAAHTPQLFGLSVSFRGNERITYYTLPDGSPALDPAYRTVPHQVRPIRHRRRRTQPRPRRRTHQRGRGFLPRRQPNQPLLGIPPF